MCKLIELVIAEKKLKDERLPDWSEYPAEGLCMGMRRSSSVKRELSWYLLK
jgi:hypothetical protein